MRNRHFFKPTNPPDSKVPIWSATGDRQQTIEISTLLGKLIRLHHTHGAPMRFILQVTPDSMELIRRIIYSGNLQVEILPKPYRF